MLFFQWISLPLYLRGDVGSRQFISTDVNGSKADSSNGLIKCRCAQIFGLKICKGENRNSDTSSSIIISGKRNLEWGTDCDLEFTNSFRVKTIDFNCDSHPKVVLIDYLSETMGMGIGNDRIAVFSATDQLQPLFFNVNDYDPSIFVANKNKIKILATEWVAKVDSKNVYTYYLVGRPYRFDNGSLVPEINESLLIRRYTKQMENERNHSRKRGILSLLKGVSGEKEITDPWLSGESKSKVSFVIGSLKIINLQGLNKLQAQLKDEKGRISDCIYPLLINEKPQNQNVEIDRIGDLNSRRLFPVGYIPSNYEVWTDKKCELETIKMENGDEKKVLWL